MNHQSNWWKNGNKYIEIEYFMGSLAQILPQNIIFTFWIPRFFCLIYGFAVWGKENMSSTIQIGAFYFLS